MNVNTFSFEMALNAEQIKFIIVENENHTIQAKSLLESQQNNKNTS